MEHLDNEIKIYNYKYTTDQKMGTLTSNYFFYTFKFVINYESYYSMSKILNTIEEKQAFEEGRKRYEYHKQKKLSLTKDTSK